MPTIDKIAREIRDFEGFDVRIRQADSTSNNAAKMPGYKRRYNRIAWNTFTVNDWRRRRFEGDYPEYTVDVLKPDGSVATGKTALAKLRSLYERNNN